MSALLRRLRGLVARYRVDRRLPPPVRALLDDVVRYRRREMVSSARAALRPILGRDGQVARLDDRRLAVAGSLDRPVSELAIDTATEVASLLTRAGIEFYLTERVGDGLVFGLAVEDRGRAIDAIAGLGAGWFVRWDDRSRAGLFAAEDLDRTRCRRARSLVVFRAMSIGHRSTGPEAGVTLTYYQLGTSGELELVGTRGHERFDPRSPSTTEHLEGRRFPGRAAFPVGAGLERFVGPVDVVYTWVDGADPAWVDDFRRTAGKQGRAFDDSALDPARYHSRDELRYSLRSLWMYAGWVNHVYIVTAGQRPPWLADHPAVTVVDHAEILAADARPTFNSHAIEASLHLIDGLSEHFVYFNDDMFLGRPTRPELFFTVNGLARVFQSGARVSGYEDEETLAVDTAARRGRELLIGRFGRTTTHKPLHSPYPLRRSALHALDRDFPDEVAATRRSRFRSPADLSVAASLGQHYALACGSAVLSEIDTEYVHVESGRLQWHLDRIRLGRRFDTYCINETRSGPDDPDREMALRTFFEELHPVPAPWELEG